MKWRPHLGSMLLMANLVVLILPLAGIGVLRVYESELVRRTESELIVQGALIAAAYRDALLREFEEAQKAGSTLDPNEYGLALPDEQLQELHALDPLRHIPATLHFAWDPVLPPAPDAEATPSPPDHYARRAGERITFLLQTARNVTLTGIRVTDYRGTVVATSGGELGLSLVPREEIRRALQGEHVSLMRTRVWDGPRPPLESISRGAHIRVFVAMPALNGDRVVGTVALSRTPLDILKALYSHGRILLGGAVALLVVAILMSVLTSFTISRPVRALVRQAERVSSGDKAAAVPLEKPGTYEVALLSQAVASMADTLQRREEHTRTFASNVSHAFKTPLASVRGAVELLRDHMEQMSPEDKERFLEILERDTNRLERLVFRLLDLVKAETARLGEESTDVAQQLEQTADRFRSSGLTVALQLDPRAMRVNMDRATFESILSSLLENALQHGQPGVQVNMSTRLLESPQGRFVELKVADNGPGIPEAHRARVFEPFFTTAQAKGGTGLGLAIVHSLVIAHRGRISLDDTEAGTQFRLTLPA